MSLLAAPLHQLVIVAGSATPLLLMAGALRWSSVFATWHGGSAGWRW